MITLNNVCKSFEKTTLFINDTTNFL